MCEKFQGTKNELLFMVAQTLKIGEAATVELAKFQDDLYVIRTYSVADIVRPPK